MKIKVIVAALAAFGASSTFAAAYDATKSPCKVARVADPANGVTALTVQAALDAMPIHCRPEVTLFITGASAPANSVNFVVPETIFETTNRFKIIVNTPDPAINGVTTAWYGIGKSTLQSKDLAGKRI